mmetsp:Transcript_40468/g.86201  ORF Transcript_40468/g.86201 Transcript_40468/m.86201 type:complete len:213 (-) Transcript_40468:334-972(-)
MSVIISDHFKSSSAAEAEPPLKRQLRAGPLPLCRHRVALPYQHPQVHEDGVLAEVLVVERVQEDLGHVVQPRVEERDESHGHDRELPQRRVQHQRRGEDERVHEDLHEVRVRERHPAVHLVVDGVERAAELGVLPQQRRLRRRVVPKDALVDGPVRPDHHPLHGGHEQLILRQVQALEHLELLAIHQAPAFHPSQPVRRGQDGEPLRQPRPQ